MQNIKISKEEQKWADDALEHTFFVHKGCQPSYYYGKDINLSLIHILQEIPVRMV